LLLSRAARCSSDVSDFLRGIERYRFGGVARENVPSLCWANMPSQVLQIKTDIDLPDFPMPLG
jgi:hypothetical protein